VPRIWLRDVGLRQKHLQKLHQPGLEKSKKEIVALKNEKLQAESGVLIFSKLIYQEVKQMMY
jgi:hypothetical protein